MLFDKPVIRVTVKCLVLLSAGFSGFFVQGNLALAISLLLLSVAFQAVDYLISHRITTLVLERITGILEGAYNSCGFPADADVRATVFVESPNKKDMLRQLGRYYPTNRYSSFRRGISSSKGIIGFCFRSGKRYLEVVRHEDSFKERLVASWGFTKQEADIVKVRRSYLAIPIFDAQGKTLGVAYFDSMKENAFTPEIIDTLTRACVPLSKWVG